MHTYSHTNIHIHNLPPKRLSIADFPTLGYPRTPTRTLRGSMPRSTRLWNILMWVIEWVYVCTRTVYACMYVCTRLGSMWMCMCVCVFVCVRVCVGNMNGDRHISIQKHEIWHLHIFSDMHVYMSTNRYMNTYIHTHKYVRTYMSTYIHACIPVVHNLSSLCQPRKEQKWVSTELIHMYTDKSKCVHMRVCVSCIVYVCECVCMRE